jgi:hypothetical protein
MKQILLIMLMLTTIGAFAQDFSIGPEKVSSDTNKSPLEKTGKQKSDSTLTIKERLYFGGNLGAQFGTVTFVDISPMIGIKIHPIWSLGIQSTGQYLNNARLGYSTTILGITTFSRVKVYNELFLQGEYGILNGNFSVFNGERETIQTLLLGGGYSYGLGSKMKMYGTVMFDVLRDIKNPYTNPLIRIGFSYNF